MIALGLASTLFELTTGGDASTVAPGEIMERFESLRAYGKLPRGRERRNQQLTDGEIATTILGLVSPSPKWAGHTATILSNLQAEGGKEASFSGAATLQATIERILADESARKQVIRLAASGAESGTNSHGSASLIYEVDGERRRVFYVPKEAVSQLQAGMEQRFDVDLRHSPLSREVSFNRRFFERIAKAIALAKLHPAPLQSDGSEYDAEEAREARFRKLGAHRGSRFLNVGVETQATWPNEEITTQLDRYTLALMPKTQTNAPSIHIDLTANQLTHRDAVTVINRFLSLMTWCHDQFAIAQDGWSGNPVPVAVPRRDLAFTTARNWTFNWNIPQDEIARRALAIYREGRNAEQNYMVSYAVLNYYKVVEIGQKGRGDVRNWFRDNFDGLRQQGTFRGEFDTFVKLCDGQEPHEYIYDACRIAVAHGGKDSKSNPDDGNELIRLHTAAKVMRIFARHFIVTAFGISDIMYAES